MPDERSVQDVLSTAAEIIDQSIGEEGRYLVVAFNSVDDGDGAPPRTLITTNVSRAALAEALRDLADSVDEKNTEN